MTTGAAQGSIVDCGVWNVSSDGTLGTNMSTDTFLVEYVDDITAVTVARNTEVAIRRLNQVTRRMGSQREQHVLDLATVNQKMYCLPGNGSHNHKKMQVGSKFIQTKDMSNKKQ